MRECIGHQAVLILADQYGVARIHACSIAMSYLFRVYSRVSPGQGGFLQLRRNPSDLGLQFVNLSCFVHVLRNTAIQKQGVKTPILVFLGILFPHAHIVNIYLNTQTFGASCARTHRYTRPRGTPSHNISRYFRKPNA